MVLLKVSTVLLLVCSLWGLATALPQRNSGSGVAGDCAFGKEYFDGCNHCICHGKSGSTCSRMPSCTTTSTTTGSSISSVIKGANSRPNYSRRQCPQGEEYMKDCNICTCHGDQGYICTTKECYNAQSVTPSRPGTVSIVKDSSSRPADSSSNKERCILGHQYYRGCEICTCYGEHFGYRCAKSGKCDTEYITSSNANNKDAGRPVVSDSENKCPRGYSYEDGYYYCVCRKDRKGYVCTSSISSG